jgi:hypothetical protein
MNVNNLIDFMTDNDVQDILDNLTVSEVLEVLEQADTTDYSTIVDLLKTKVGINNIIIKFIDSLETSINPNNDVTQFVESVGINKVVSILNYIIEYSTNINDLIEKIIEKNCALYIIEQLASISYTTIKSLYLSLKVKQNIKPEWFTNILNIDCEPALLLILKILENISTTNIIDLRNLDLQRPEIIQILTDGPAPHVALLTKKYCERVTYNDALIKLMELVKLDLTATVGLLQGIIEAAPANSIIELESLILHLTDTLKIKNSVTLMGLDNTTLLNESEYSIALEADNIIISDMILDKPIKGKTKNSSIERITCPGVDLTECKNVDLIELILSGDNV